MTNTKKDIHWFPGHMAKTIKELKQKINGIDIIIECLDARIPLASRNPVIDELIGDKQSHIIALTKSDLADPAQTKAWVDYFKTKADYSLALVIPQHKGIKQLLNLCNQIADKKRQNKRFHISKILVCGIPNVGKSALINRCASKAVAKVQNKPGVTKQTRGILLSQYLEIIDSPGLLWPKLEQETVAIRLALCSAIKQTLLNDKDLSDWLLSYMLQHYKDKLNKRYQINCDKMTIDELTNCIADTFHFLEKKGEFDYPRTYRKIINDFTSDKFKQVSLESPLDIS